MYSLVTMWCDWVGYRGTGNFGPINNADTLAKKVSMAPFLRPVPPCGVA